MSYQTIIKFTVALAFATALCAQPAVNPAPSNAGLSTTARVDAIFAEALKADGPGCALGVYQDDKVVYEKGYGLASLEHLVH